MSTVLPDETARPVSALLAEEVRRYVRQQGVVIWLDAAGHYTGFVDRLIASWKAGEHPFPVVGWRGSHLELLLALAPHANGADPTPLLVHMPGFNEETVATTPVLELWEAGKRYRKSLDTLVTDAAAGVVRPEQTAAFLAQGNVTLEKADAWLAALGAQRDGGLRVQLQAMSLVAVVDDLLSGGFVAGRVAEDADRGALWHWLGAQTGVDEPWREQAGTDRGAEDVAFGVASWALCVEYVHDLKRKPFEAVLQRMTDLPRPTIEACVKLAVHLREHHPAFYGRTADDVERWLEREVLDGTPEDLGRIDTFRFEEDRILEAALAGLEEERWAQVAAWAADRVDGRSFWLRDDAARRSAWLLVADAARLGRAIEDAGHGLPKVARSLDEAVDHYQRVGAAVDRAHRQLEQRRTALLLPQLPDFAVLRDRLDGLRSAWRSWADELHRAFVVLAKADGWLPSTTGLQQRSLFDEVVRPMTQESGPTAFFVVDALRYEMATELLEAIDGTPATTAHLKARLAELPTVTSVGMNALAPVAAGGRLRPVLRNGSIEGFQAAEFQVTGIESRKRAMAERAGGDTCPWLTLGDVLSRSAPSLKQAVARAKLVVIHSTEIDDAGEKGVGLAVFDVVLQKLRAAWRLLREAGVRRFVITSDHGFLLLDSTTRTSQPHGRKIDPSRRHAWTQVPADHAGEARVSLASLGYDGAEGWFQFPESTAVFDTGRSDATFVHGGPSLQERVIPVLTVVHRSGTGGDTLRYAVKASFAEGVAGMHCVRGRVETASQEGLSFGGASDIELALRVPGRSDVAVELCQTRQGARLAGGAVVAKVGEEFEVFFRLVGPADERVVVEVHHPTGIAEVASALVDARFDVAGVRPGAAPAAPASDDWLASLPEGGRAVFAHLHEHGSLTEAEALQMLGGASRLRRFAVQFDELARKVPFRVRIETIGGVKRFVREGS